VTYRALKSQQAHLALIKDSKPWPCTGRRHQSLRPLPRCPHSHPRRSATVRSFFLSTPAGDDGDTQPPAIESIYVEVEKTTCSWAVPLSSVQPASEQRSDNVFAFLENPAHSTPRLTQAGMQAVNAAFK